MNNIGAFKKKWIENPSDEKGVLLYLPVSEVFILQSLNWRKFF